MKKKIAILLGAVYAVTVFALCFEVIDFPYLRTNPDAQQSTEVQHPTDTQEVPDATESAGELDGVEPQEPENSLIDLNRDFSIVENNLEYGNGAQDNFYILSEDVLLSEEDKMNLLARYNLPALERMSAEDAEEKMSQLQVLEKIRRLGIDTNVFYTPEYNWKALYNDSLTQVKERVNFEETIEFTGTKASELNTFLQENTGAGFTVKVMASEILLDENILVPSNVILDGNGAVIQGTEAVTYAMLLEGVENVGIYNFCFTSGFEYGIYIIDSDYVLVHNNEITNAIYKALCVMDANSYVNLVNNSIHDNGNGAIFFNGEITNCIIQGNAVYQNRGTRNLTAGIVFSSMKVADPYTAYNEFLDEYLYDLQETAHDNVVKDNLIQGNYSSGFYCDGGYMNYIIDNVIEENEKEGMCLDYGSFGNYVNGNTIRANGDRNRQTDEDLEADFILGAGRLPDGSSTAKLPGVSIDNSAYNIVSNNNVTENSGSGIKMVRSGYRNIILSNIVSGNNRGKNDAFHGFGVELGHASTPDEPVIGLDFTADYENIVARNVITGAHYSGIFMGEDSYCNDLIDNIIMDSYEFSVENHSTYFNSAVGNTTTVGTLNIELR